MPTYSRKEFHDACKQILGEDAYNRYTKAGCNIPDMCEKVAIAMLLNEMQCSETMVLKVVQETAYNLWRDDGCHHLT